VADHVVNFEIFIQISTRNITECSTIHTIPCGSCGRGDHRFSSSANLVAHLLSGRVRRSTPRPHSAGSGERRLPLSGCRKGTEVAVSSVPAVLLDQADEKALKGWWQTFAPGTSRAGGENPEWTSPLCQPAALSSHPSGKELEKARRPAKSTYQRSTVTIAGLACCQHAVRISRTTTDPGRTIASRAPRRVRAYPPAVFRISGISME
jgi:hypothetical protein